MPVLAGTGISYDTSVLQRKQRLAISTHPYSFTCSKMLFATHRVIPLKDTMVKWQINLLLTFTSSSSWLNSHQPP